VMDVQSKELHVKYSPMNSDYISNSISKLVCVMENQFAFCEVGTEFVNIIYMKFVIQRAMMCAKVC
jgi:hypothetical protein